MEDRAVVVDSLLCFIKNFRHEANLEALVAEHFSPATQSFSTNLLLDLLQKSDEFSLQQQEPPKFPATFKQTLALFDRIASGNEAPLFVTDNLTCLPMVLLGKNTSSIDRDGSVERSSKQSSKSSDVFNEIRQIRYFIQDVLQQPAVKQDAPAAAMVEPPNAYW
jgi:hypothetical protein